MSKNVQTKQFDRFLKFHNWWINFSGRFLTADEIDLIFDKFKQDDNDVN